MFDPDKDETISFGNGIIKMSFDDKEKFVVRISFPSYKEWWEIENEFRNLVKNTKATVYIEKI